MLCQKCVYLDRSTETDRYGNIHIYWTCRKKFWSILHQVNYNDLFLSDLRSGRVFNYTDGFKNMLPYMKGFRDIQSVEILFQRKVDECKDYLEKLKQLDSYGDKK
jgi:hypothetical protein